MSRFFPGAGVRLGLGVGTTLSLLVVSNAAWAWEPIAVCLNGPVTWSATSVSYRLNDAGSDNFSFPALEAAAAEAWDAWAGPCCTGWSVVEVPPTPARWLNSPGENVIAFEESQWDGLLGDPATTIGITLLAGPTTGCSIDEADVLFNGVQWVFISGDPVLGSRQVNLPAALTHELGHFLGLGHTDVPGATMTAVQDRGADGATLEPDDLVGVCELYPASCLGREALCADTVDDDLDGWTDCEDSDCLGAPACQCGAQGILRCGETFQGTTSGVGQSRLEGYACGVVAGAGPEGVVRLDGGVGGEVIVELVGPQGQDLELVAMGEVCHPARCTGSVAQGGMATKSLAVTAGGPGPSWLAVEDPAGVGLPFSLTLGCDGAWETACGNGRDDDGDGGVDCLDADCAGVGDCPVVPDGGPGGGTDGGDPGAQDGGDPGLTDGAADGGELGHGGEVDPVGDGGDTPPGEPGSAGDKARDGDREIDGREGPGCSGCRAAPGTQGWLWLVLWLGLAPRRRKP